MAMGVGGFLGAYWLYRRFSVRGRIVAEAKSVVGMGATKDAKAFGEYLGGASEDPNMQTAMATSPASSTCGLTVRAIWRNAGVSDPRLEPPYAPRIGLVISDEIAIAKERGAWVDPKPGVWPEEGDMAGYALNQANGHVDTIISATPRGDELDLVTVDGGAVDAFGRQEIAQRSRTWRWEHGVLMDHPEGGYVRPVTGWVDVGQL
jgi:hypothetical protein